MGIIHLDAIRQRLSATICIYQILILNMTAWEELTPSKLVPAAKVVCI